MKTICLFAVVLAAVCATGCTNLSDPLGPDDGATAPAGTYTSIAYAPASQPCCGPTPAAAPARPAGVRPGEVWCYVKVPGEVCTRSERVLVAPGRWEWQRSASCEVPGTAPAGAAGPQVRRDLSSGVRPGEVWCQVWVPPVYETKTTTTPVSSDRWEWRRTSECDVPGTAATP